MIRSFSIALVATVILGVCTTPLTANDGVFAGSSGVLHPMRPTRVRILHEWLAIRFHELYADVNVRFHFYNPDDTIVVLPVGFVVPRCAGVDLTEREYNRPGVRRFQTQMDEELQKYDLFEWPCDTCALVRPSHVKKDTNDVDYSGGSDFVFLSTLRFKPGNNVVTHAYRQELGSHFNTMAEFDYVLTTAQHWQGQVIDTFECDISLLPNVVCDVKGFSTVPFLGIVGIGERLPAPKDEYTYDGDQQYRVLNGSLQFMKHSFEPKENLLITLYDSFLFTNDEEDHNGTHTFGAEQIELNAIYASHGLIFADTTVQREFEKQSWYIPDPNCTIRTMAFSVRERERLVWLKQQIKKNNMSKKMSPTK